MIKSIGFTSLVFILLFTDLPPKCCTKFMLTEQCYNGLAELYSATLRSPQLMCSSTLRLTYTLMKHITIGGSSVDSVFTSKAGEGTRTLNIQLGKICSHHSHLAGTLSDVTSYRFAGGMQRHTSTRNYTHLDTVVGRKTVVDSSRKTYSRSNPSTGVNLTISGPVFRGQVIVNTDENYRRKLWIRRFQY